MAYGALLSGMNGRTRDALQDANATSLWPHLHTLALPSHNPTAQAGHEEGFREIITVKCTYVHFAYGRCTRGLLSSHFTFLYYVRTQYI